MGMWSWAHSEEESVRLWLPTLFTEGWPAVREALLQGADSKKPDLAQVTAALAAACIVGAARGGPDPEIPPDVSQWIAKNQSTLDPSMVPLALSAVRRAEEYNESNWAEADESLGYQTAAKELRERLGELDEDQMRDSPES